MNATTPVAALHNVSVLYRAGDGSRVQALDDVSLALHAGELVGIFGPSGCGKTTLLMVTGWLEPPTDGSIFFDGAPINQLVAGETGRRDFRRKNIGFVFQKPNLIPFLSALDNVALAMIIDGVPATAANRRAMVLLDLLDVAHRATNHPAALSGGEQQRVAIARALANSPRLILADEPTAALDGARGRRSMELLQSIARSMRTSIAVVTHDARSADLFDRTLEMEDGRIVSERSQVMVRGAVTPMSGQSSGSGQSSSA
jgi:putative ABC transport system ATP-binding protein